MTAEGGREQGPLKSCEAGIQQVQCQDLVNKGLVVRCSLQRFSRARSGGYERTEVIPAWGHQGRLPEGGDM